MLINKLLDLAKTLTMIKHFYFFLALYFSCNVFGQSYSGPESVEFDYTNNRWLIGNKNSHEVLARDASGNLTLLIPSSDIGSSGPFGIEITNNVLYMCCGAIVKGFDLSTLELVFSVNTGGTFLNGITHDNDGNLFVTDFTAKKIYKIDIANQESTIVASDLVQQPNGIIFDEPNNRCVFVNWGSNAPIKSLNLIDNTVSTILSTNHGNCDGIARDGNGAFYISMWQGQQVVKYNNDFSESNVVLNQGLSSPADLFFNTQDMVLGIPNSGNNTVTFMEFSLNTEELVLETFNVYPNPVQDELIIRWNEGISIPENLEFYDLSGKLIHTINPLEHKIENNAIRVNVGNLNSGVYFVHIELKTQREIVRIVVQ